MKVDFSKPIEIKWIGEYEWRPARVLGPVLYKNFLFTHAIIISNGDNSESVLAAGPSGIVEHQQYVIRNTPPKVVSEYWVNLYKDGDAGERYKSRFDADFNKRGFERFGYYVTKTCDDGSVTNEVIKIEE